MSKAFTRESDDLPERPALKRPASALPPGAKNYFTQGGVDKLRRELEELASATDSPSVRQRISEIQQSLQSAVVTPPPPPPWGQVLFGATVTVRDQQGGEITYRIVGVDETDIDCDWISWISPLARALLKARVGDHIRFRAPAGEQNLEIVAVRYEP
jgi:transcription elongation factor GreB